MFSFVIFSDEPDFAAMPASEKVARTLAKWDRILS